MELTPDSPKPQYNDLTIEQVNNGIERAHNLKLLIALHEVQMDMERKADYNHVETITLGDAILKSEEAAAYFDEHGDQPTTPYLPRQRQDLLRRTAVLFLYGRQIIPEYNRSIDDCIRKYNDLERQVPSGEENEPQLIGYEAIMNDLGEIRGRANHYLHQQRWTTKAVGKIGMALSRLNRKD